jgi:hypothetical protein
MVSHFLMSSANGVVVLVAVHRYDVKVTGHRRSRHRHDAAPAAAHRCQPATVQAM